MYTTTNNRVLALRKERSKQRLLINNLLDTLSNIETIKTLIICLLGVVMLSLFVSSIELKSELQTVKDENITINTALRDLESLDLSNQAEVSEYISSLGDVRLYCSAGVTKQVSEQLIRATNNISLQYNQLENDYEQLEIKYNEMSRSYSSMNSIIDDLQTQSEELLKENKTLIKKLNTVEEDLEKFSKREELYDKYEYAIYYDGRTDLTYDQLILIEDLCDKYDISPYLVTGQILVESGGREKVKNSSSTARGYGQILRGTGKFVYEEILKYGTYNHDMAFNGDLNIEMQVAYLNYLRNEKGSMEKAICSYRGADYATNQAYINKICRVSGKTRAQILL